MARRKPTLPWKHLVTARKRAEAEARQAKRDARSTAEQLRLISLRPGESRKERARLETTVKKVPKLVKEKRTNA